MDLMELGDIGSVCEDENCSLSPGFPENCSNQGCQWEEPMFGLIELVCVTVIYIPLMLFGLLGNTLTILVVWLRPHMRSSTYLYLSSMAVSDLLILLLLPLDLYKLWRPRPWPLGDLACKLTMFLSECCTFCTILHITFLSMERYLAVCWPIAAKTLVTRRRTRALIGCLWLGAAVSAAPVLVMVGVEEVGAEELGLGEWREDRGWTGGEGEQGGLMIGRKTRESGHMASMDGGSEGIEWGEKVNGPWEERVGDLKGFRMEGERKMEIGERDEGKKGDGGRIKGEKQADEGGGEEEGKMKVEVEWQNKMKEDEGGGREEGVDGSLGEDIDKRECRCTQYAVSSGLLAAMMILSNLYFLVPLLILGLVYSLIGRALWLRPQSSRRDQSHRHTVKMLGVIVLAFVLCWLPFHVGRTIFSLSLGTGSDGQEAYTDTTAHVEMNTLSASADRDITVTEPMSHSDSDFKTGKVGRQRVNADASERHLGPVVETDTQTATYTETHDDTAHAETQRGRFTDDGGTNAASHNDTHKVLHWDTGFQGDARANTRPDRQSYTDVDTLASVQPNRPLLCMNSQNITANYTPSATGPFAYPVTPTYLYNAETHRDTRFNDTHANPDSHLYFLYYLSQYFNLVSSVLFYLSAAVNPLLYNLMSARYRHAVHSLVHAHAHAQSQRLRTLAARHSMTTL